MEILKVVLLERPLDDNRDQYDRVDITKRVWVCDARDASPIGCKLVLNARDGYFKTKGPIINHWDKIYVKLKDRKNKIFHTVVHVDTIHLKDNTSYGEVLELTCPHESSNLLKRKIPLVTRRGSGRNALYETLNIINTNKGTEDPTIRFDDFGNEPKIGNSLNDNIENDYIIEMVPAGAAINDILIKEAQPITAGGSLRFYFFRFVSLYNYDTNTDLGWVAPQIFPQGYRDDGNGGLTSIPTVTITKKGKIDSPGVLNSTNATFESETATNVVAIGSKTADSYPKNYVKYLGEKDSLLLIPEWEYEKSYIHSNRVRFNGTVYEAKITTSPHHSPAIYNDEWKSVNVSSSVNPSPLTRQKAQYWINATPGFIHAGTVGSKKTAVVDMNGFLKVPGKRRTGVHCVTNDSDNIVNLGFAYANGKPFDGMRVLVIGDGLNDFAGNDIHDKPKANNILIYTDDSWHVLPHWGITQIDDEVWSIREGDCYTYKPQNPLLPIRFDGWKLGAYDVDRPDGNTVGYTDGASFDCLHPMSRYPNGQVKIENTSIVPDEDPDGNSAVSFEFDAINERGMFAGANFSPGLWPMNSNDIPYSGSYTIGEIINKPYFDFSNMDKDKDGLRRTFGEEIEQYLPINGFGFWEKLEVRTILDSLVWGGDFNMGIWLVDENDTVIIISYSHGHNDTTESKNPKISNYEIHRGVYTRPGLVQPNVPENIGIFDWRKVWYGGICTLDSYNEYRVFLDRFDWIETLFGQKNRFFEATKLKLSLDMFRYTKPLVATNVTNSNKPERNIETKFLRNGEIFLYPQLKNFAVIMGKLLAFRKKRINPDTELRCDVEFGDPIYYTNHTMINESVDGKLHTVKTVCSAVNYSVSKPGKDGPGGFKRNLETSTILYPEDL